MKHAASAPKLPESRIPSRWFWVGLGLLFILSAALRFWGLSRFNTLVFDEVYYAKYGNDYLHHTPFFDVHPPLGKYLIALGIRLSQLSLWEYTIQTQTDALQLPTVAYRWMNALTGSFIPVVVAGLAYQLSDRRSFALLAGFFVALDGLILVESRYALINIYLVIFGLLGQFFVLRAVKGKRLGGRNQIRPKTKQVKGTPSGSAKRQGSKSSSWLNVPFVQGNLLLAGICFGASMSVKWNGLFFLTGLYFLWGLGWAIRGWQLRQGQQTQGTALNATLGGTDDRRSQPNWFTQFTQVHPLTWMLYLGGVPVLVYCLLWLPHLGLNPDMGFWQLHQQILGYHQNLGSGDSEHPYCSTWQSWLGMVRPIGYYYQTVMPPPTAVVNSIQQPVVYDVHGMGNPILWWFSTIAIFLLAGLLVGAIARHVIPAIPAKRPILSPSLTGNLHLWIWLYLVVNYAANFLPWTRVSRCLFIYHYMGSAVFAMMAIALLVDYNLRTPQLEWRPLGIAIILAVVLSFWFWLPLYLGLPLSPEGFQARMWLRSWI